MSGKREKAIRKLAKQELEKRMNQQGQAQPPQIGLQIIQFLENFIQLCETLTGEKPSALTLTDIMYNAYVQESQRHAEVLGLKTGFKDDQVSFNGVKLVRKSPIVGADGGSASVKPTIETSSAPTTPTEEKVN